MIAIDFVGCGDSGKLNEKYKYGPELFIDNIVEFIDLLEIKNPIIYGCSLGGHIATQAMSRLSDIQYLFLCGVPPLANPPLEGISPFQAAPEVGLLFQEKLSKSERILFSEGLCSSIEDQELIGSFVSMSDPRMRLNLGEEIFGGNYLNEIDILSKTNKNKFHLVFGNQDRIVNLDYVKKVSNTLGLDGNISYINGGHIAHLDNYNSFREILLSKI